MKLSGSLLTIATALIVATAQADLTFTFDTDVEGFQNVNWQAANPAGWPGLPGSLRQTHTAGGWQMMMTKEFSWGPGGGNANQQLEMQALANSGNARISFDVMVDGASFPPDVAGWFQFAVVGNSDGAAGWSQMGDIFTAATYHNANDPALLTQHYDFAFAQFGWQPGDTWFQFWTGANSDAANPVNFYLDNVKLYAVPEPTAVALLSLGALGLFLWRNRF